VLGRAQIWVDVSLGVMVWALVGGGIAGVSEGADSWCSVCWGSECLVGVSYYDLGGVTPPEKHKRRSLCSLTF